MQWSHTEVTHGGHTRRSHTEVTHLQLERLLERIDREPELAPRRRPVQKGRQRREGSLAHLPILQQRGGLVGGRSEAW